MRITNSIIHRRTLDSLQQNASRLAEAQEQVTTGLRIRRASDDPAGAVGVLNADGRLRALEQYRRNIGATQARLSAEETVLDQLTSLLTRAKELGMAQAGSPSNATTRRLAQVEVDALFRETVSLGNSRFGETYLFGGAFAADRPFAADGSTSATRPPSGANQVEIESGRTVSLNHDGLQVFTNTGVFDALRRLSTGLATDSEPDIRAALTQLDTALSGVQDLLGETGARISHLEMARSNIEALDVNLRTFRSDLSEVEIEEAISGLVMRQNTFQAALLATSRIMSLTLTDYLR